jgi:hypothetical protein
VILLQYQSQNRCGGHYVDAERVFDLVLGKLADCDIWFHCGADVAFAGIILRRDGVTRWL